MQRHFPSSVSVAFVLGALASSASAQRLLYSLDGSGVGGRGPSGVAGADSDGDGIADIAVLVSGVAFPGRIDLRSGATGAFIRSLFPPTPIPGSKETLIPPVFSLGDITGDQLGDWACLEYGQLWPNPVTSRVVLFDGATGAMLTAPTFTGPISHALANIGDFNGDGKDDLAFGQPAATTTTVTYVVVFGWNGASYGSACCQPLFNGFGYAVAGAGDLDHDGRADLLVSAPHEPLAGGTFGRVYAYGYQSATSLRLIRTFDSASASLNAMFGSALTQLDDVDGDGTNDVAIADSGSKLVRLYSGGTQAVLWTAALAPKSPVALARAGDVDGDGRTDLLVGTSQDVVLLSGASGTTLFTYSDAATAGGSVGGELDLDGDGCLDFVVGSASHLSVVSTDCAIAQPLAYCTSSTSANSCTPAIGSSGRASVSNATSFTIAVTALDGQRNGLLFYGLGTAAIPWGGASSSTLCVSAPRQRTAVTNSLGTLGACDGTLVLDFNSYMAANPTALGSPYTAGQALYAQGWFRDPAAALGSNLSDALSYVLGP